MMQILVFMKDLFYVKIIFQGITFIMTPLNPNENLRLDLSLIGVGSSILYYTYIFFYIFHL